MRRVLPSCMDCNSIATHLSMSNSQAACRTSQSPMQIESFSTLGACNSIKMCLMSFHLCLMFSAGTFSRAHKLCSESNLPCLSPQFGGKVSEIAMFVARSGNINSSSNVKDPHICTTKTSLQCQIILSITHKRTKTSCSGVNGNGCHCEYSQC